MISLFFEFQSVKAEVASGFTADIETWQPEDPTDVMIDLTISIGVVGELGTNDFRTIICTPIAVRKNEREFGKEVAGLDQKFHPIVVDRYEWPAIRASLVKNIEACERDTWEESRDELRKIFCWEYEGMYQN